MPAPRLPPLLEDQLAFPTAVGGDHARMLGRYGPDGVPVFVKQWRPGAGPELDTRMQWQAAAARALGDGCPPVLQRLRWSGAVWTVTRWLPGEAPSLPFTGGVLRQAVALLNRLHRAGFAHGDIKQDNFLLTPSGRLLLLDLDEVWHTGWSGPAPVLGPPSAQDPHRQPASAPSPRGDGYALGTLLADGPLRRALHAPLPIQRPPGLNDVAVDLPTFPAIPPDLPPVMGWVPIHAVPTRARALRQGPLGEAVLHSMAARGIGHMAAGRWWLEPTQLAVWWGESRPEPLTPAALLDTIDRGFPHDALAHAAHGTDPDPDLLLAAALACDTPAALRRAWRKLPQDHYYQSILTAALLADAGHHAQALDMLQHPGDRPSALTLRSLAHVDPHAALAALDGDHLPPDTALHLMALCHEHLGEIDLAVDHLTRACRTALPLQRARSATLASGLLLTSGRPEEALPFAQDALLALPPGAHPHLRSTAAAHERRALEASGARLAPSPELLHVISHHCSAETTRQAAHAEARLAERAGDPELDAHLLALTVAPDA